MAKRKSELVMEEKKIQKLLNELSQATSESADPALAERIKDQICSEASPHRKKFDTVRIMIDLRVSKLAAAAAITIATILFANLFGTPGSKGDNLYQDGKRWVKYCLIGGGSTRADVLAGMSKYQEHLIRRGREVIYYGDNIDPADSNAILMQWKLSDGSYGVMFADLSTRTVTA